MNRRVALGVGLAGAAGLLTTRSGAHTGLLTDAEVEKLMQGPRAASDYTKLAQHFEALRVDAEAEAKRYEQAAAQYRKQRLAGATESQSFDAARALEHVAEHARDSAEALEHLAETFKGLAEHFHG